METGGGADGAEMVNRVSHGGARKGSGRKRTAPPRATISLTFPLPIVEAYRALDEKTGNELRLRMKAAVESTCTPK